MRPQYHDHHSHDDHHSYKQQRYNYRAKKTRGFWKKETQFCRRDQFSPIRYRPGRERRSLSPRNRSPVRRSSPSRARSPVQRSSPSRARTYSPARRNSALLPRSQNEGEKMDVQELITAAREASESGNKNPSPTASNTKRLLSRKKVVSKKPSTEPVPKKQKTSEASGGEHVPPVGRPQDGPPTTDVPVEGADAMTENGVENDSPMDDLALTVRTWFQGIEDPEMPEGLANLFKHYFGAGRFLHSCFENHSGYWKRRNSRLEDRVATLERELAKEKARSANLVHNLAEEKARSTTLANSLAEEKEHVSSISSTTIKLNSGISSLLGHIVYKTELSSDALHLVDSLREKNGPLMEKVQEISQRYHKQESVTPDDLARLKKVVISEALIQLAPVFARKIHSHKLVGKKGIGRVLDLL